MATPYQNIAKSALINWNGLSEDEADKKIQTESVQELEGQVFAFNSIKYAVLGIAKQVKLSENETLSFLQAVIKGPENDSIFDVVSRKANNFTIQQQIGVLSTIHDGWVINNFDEKTFNKKVDRKQLRQYAPLELIGWNEVKSDLLFLEPILNSIHVNINEKELENVYHQNVNYFMDNNNIDSQESLTSLIASGHEYYPILPTQLEMKLAPMISDMSAQIIDNWNKKDLESAQLFHTKQKTNGYGL